MVIVRVGASQKPLEEAVQGGWIAEQFQRQKDDRDSICVQVTIKDSGVDLLLSTPNCPSAPSSWRRLTPEEERIFELWRKRGLDEQDVAPGKVEAFLRQLSQLF